MTFKIHTVRLFTMLALAGAATAAAPEKAQLVASKHTSAVSAPRPSGIESILIDESITTPVHEPADGYSAKRRSEEAWRNSLRKQIGWEQLDQKTKDELWDFAVGPDQIDERGAPLVSFAWAYTPQIVQASDRQARDTFLNVEGDLVVAGSRTTPNDRVLITEVRGAANASDGWTQNWARNFGLAGTNTATILATTADLYGNTFVTGTIDNGNYLLWQFNGSDGATIGSLSSFTPPGGTAGSGNGVVVDPIEGYIYVCGTAGSVNTFIARHRPDTNRTRDWVVPIPAGTNPLLAGEDPIRISRRGEVYVCGDTNEKAFVAKIQPIDGSADWVWSDTLDSYGQAMDLDFDGNPYVCALGFNGQGWKVYKIDRLTGQAVWTASVASGQPQDIAVDSEGNAYVCGSASASTQQFVVRKYNAAGVLQWTQTYGTTGIARRITLDRLGNPYVTGAFSVGVDVTKLNPANGQVVWQVDDSPRFSASENNMAFSVEGINVDANGSVYVAGHRVASAPGVTVAGEYFVIKYEQPYLYIPQIIKSNPDIRIEKRSLWAPDIQDELNNRTPSLFNSSFNLFSFPLNPIESILNTILYRRITYGLQGNGLAQGGLIFDFVNNPSIGVKWETTISGGTFDATAKGELAIVAPPDGGVGGPVAGQPFSLSMNWEPDAKALELIANNFPRITSALKSSVTGDINLRGYAHDTTAGLIVDESIPFPNISDLNNRTLVQFDSNGFAIPLNEWYDIRASSPPQSTYANAQVRLPKLRASSKYDTNDALLKSTVSEKFVKGRVNLTNIMVSYATGGFVPVVEWSDSSILHDVNVYLALLQAYFRGDIAVEQDLTLELRPYVKLAFDSGASTVTLPLARTGTPGNYTYQANYTHTPGLPADGNIEITPSFGMKAVLTNRSGLRFGLYAGFEPLDVDISASAVGYDLININSCVECLEWDLIQLASGASSRISSTLNNGKLNLFNQTFPEFTFPEEQEQAPIQVVGSVNNQPQLAGSSRAFAPMIIYNQRTPPTQSAFAAQINATEPMVLYGNNFFTGSNIRVKMKHHGRTEDLTVTRLNDQALLVQVPRRFFLLPGISRIWVQTNNGRSKTMEFPIEYPVPNFTGLADQLWAGDPRWSGEGESGSEGLIAVDGGTPGGNDTFIARRDYYTYLRTTLWSTAFLPAGQTSTAVQWFPSFKGWETGPTRVPPGFPTLVALNAPGTSDDVALGRFRQAAPLPEFINDGFFRATLQEDLHRSPKFLEFALVNPGPGGGESRVRTAEIPAPKPVMNELFPAIVPPGSVAAGEFLRLDVRGPESVPFFAGYENEKYGNFTPESVVRINGVAVTTEYVSPGLLVGLIPAANLTTPGNRIITVSTPSGGTKYQETLRNGDGTVVFNGMVDSGGISDPMVLEVLWAQPVITGVSHPTLTVGEPPEVPSAVDGVPVTDGHNFSVVGENFAPNCVLYWNGNIIPSTRDDAGHIRATLTTAQVASIGQARVEVGNPAPNARTSTRVFVQIIP